MSSEEFRQCPYNPRHLVRVDNGRFVNHLYWCKLNYRDDPLKICDYNWDHHVKPDKYEEHLKVCEDKKLDDLSQWKNSQMSPFAPVKPTHPDKPTFIADADDEEQEDWGRSHQPNFQYKPILKKKSKPRRVRQHERLVALENKTNEDVAAAIAKANADGEVRHEPTTSSNLGPASFQPSASSSKVSSAPPEPAKLETLTDSIAGLSFGPVRPPAHQPRHTVGLERVPRPIAGHVRFVSPPNLGPPIRPPPLGRFTSGARHPRLLSGKQLPRGPSP